MQLHFSALASVILASSTMPGWATSYVSGTGTDSGACAQTAPCRTFGYALAGTPANGEVIVSVPGAFPPFTISKPVSIVNDGVGTAVIVPNANAAAIKIQAGASDNIQIRGFDFDGRHGSATSGIYVVSAGGVTVLNSTFKGFTNRGIDIENNSTVLTVDNSTMTDMYVSIQLQNRATISNSRFFNYYVGLEALSAQSIVSIDRCVFARGAIGISSLGGYLVLKDSTISHNTTNGIQVGGDGFVWLGHNTISGNVVGVDASSKTIVTYGDNYINGNTSSDVKGTMATSPVTR